jgi:hypothetical protein
VAVFCFTVAGLVAMHFAILGVATVFADRRLFSNGYYRALGAVGCGALVVGVVATLVA